MHFRRSSSVQVTNIIRKYLTSKSLLTSGYSTDEEVNGPGGPTIAFIGDRGFR
jgi:hypothetical protein